MLVDGDFHQSIIESAHNIVLLHFMGAVRGVLENTILSYLDHFSAESKYIEQIGAQHDAIVTAIMDRDPASARNQARAHLDFAYLSFREFQSQAKLSRNAELYASIYRHRDD